jgi:hypothetical protein
MMNTALTMKIESSMDVTRVWMYKRVSFIGPQSSEVDLNVGIRANWMK